MLFVWSRGVFDRSEDCLYLTVWAEEDIDEPRPVMVWLHGGAHTGGWGHHPIFDGRRWQRPCDCRDGQLSVGTMGLFGRADAE